jgi:curli biogenesis system outer membrane secretion channel CsgG
VQTGWFNVKERVSLGKLVDERDLGLAGIVKTPEAKAKLGNVDYLVIGGITITGVSK